MANVVVADAVTASATAIVKTSDVPEPEVTVPPVPRAVVPANMNNVFVPAPRSIAALVAPIVSTSLPAPPT